MLVIPGYESVEILGRGAHGVVFLGRSIRTKREVAIKVLADPGESDLVQRFERETEVLGGLSWHPNVVQVLDAGVIDDGRLWIAMERLGGSLAAEANDGVGINAERVADIGIQIAGALEAAHSVGIVHRDVKPGNVLTGVGGLVKLADFGIALTHQSQSRTGAHLIGTLHYMAPELFSGQRATEKSDQYGLAATLAALLLGHPPFERPGERLTAGAIIGRIIHGEQPDLRRNDVPRELSEALLRGMRADPEARHPRVDDLAEGLLAVQQAHAWPPTRYVTANSEWHAESTAPATTLVTDVADSPRAVAREAEVPRPKRLRRGAFAAGTVVAIVAGGTLVALASRDADGDNERGTGTSLVGRTTVTVSASQESSAPRSSTTSSSTTSSSSPASSSPPQSLTAPATPMSVAAGAADATTILVAWSDASDDEAGFRVYLNSVPLLPDLQTGTTMRMIRGLVPDAMYCFAVEAFNAAGASGPSTTACATTMTAGPPQPLPAAGPQPRDPATAETQIREIIDRLYPGERDPTLIADYDAGIDDALARLDAGQLGDNAKTVRPQVHELVFTSPSEAWFRYDLISDIATIKDRYGVARYSDNGTWQITRQTICQDLALSPGAECDPPVIDQYPPHSSPRVIGVRGGAADADVALPALTIEYIDQDCDVVRGVWEGATDSGLREDFIARGACADGSGTLTYLRTCTHVGSWIEYVTLEDRNGNRSNRFPFQYQCLD